jgi:heme-binding protein
MLTLSSNVRRLAVGTLGAGAIAGTMLFGALPAALANEDPAQDPPNCTAGDLEQTKAIVSAGTSAYLFTHPDVNWFFTSLEGLTKDQEQVQMKAYMADHPQVAAELKGVRQPLLDLKNRCGAPPPAPIH